MLISLPTLRTMINGMFIVVMLSSRIVHGLSPSDAMVLQGLISENLTQGFAQLGEDVLKTDEIVKLFSSQQSAEALTPGDLEAVMTSLVEGVQRQFDQARQAIEAVKNKFNYYLTHPRPIVNIGPPRIVESCCKSLDPTKSAYSKKVQLIVGNQRECCARTAETDTRGCDLRAVEALDLMKRNFENVPSVLWQEFGTVDGQLVQYPAASRSCDSAGHSVSMLLRESYRTRVVQPKLHLVVVADASDEMLDQVRQPGTIVNHWDIVKKAVVDILGSVLPIDKVAVVTAGRETRSAKGCNSTLLVNTRDNFERIKSFINKTTLDGPTDYVDAFREAFALLRSQEDLDRTYNNGDEYVNVIIVLTNAETPLMMRDGLLLKEIANGQESLTKKALISVYALQMLDKQGEFKTFLKLADQNNIQLTAFNVTAEPWPSAEFPQPVGPVGFFKSIPDIKTFGFSDDVVQFCRHLNLDSLTTLPDRLVTDPVTFNSNEGLILHTVTPLWNARSLLGLLATNLSMDVLLGGVQAFRHRTMSYAYVVERETSHVLFHPRLQFQTEAVSRNVAMATLQDVELDLSTEQRHAIMASDFSNRHFSSNLRPGRETPSPAGQACQLYHRLVAGTNFIVVMVIFDSELTKNTISSQQVTRSTSAEYHRFDLLTPSAPKCVKSGLFAQENKIGIKFSPHLFIDRSSYLYNEGLSNQQVEDLDNFIKSLSSLPNSLYSTNVPDADNYLVTDLRTMTSQRLLDVWNNTQITAIYRFISTASGIYGTVPALALPAKLDVKHYQWYTEAISLQDSTLLHSEIFPGATTQNIISKAIVSSGKVLGVVGASIPVEVLKSLLYNKLEICSRPNFKCKFINSKGYIINTENTPVTSSHITNLYPWLSTQLIMKAAMKTTWCKDVFNRHNRLNYVIEKSAVQVSGPDDCRKFVLHPVGKSNIFVVVVHANCPLAISQGCDPGPPQPPVTGRPHNRLCSGCVNGTSVVPPKCQQLCHCPMKEESCLLDTTSTTTVRHLELCEENEGQDQPTGHEARPKTPGPFESKCSKTCSETSTQKDCEQIANCYWDITKSYPTCIRTVQQTTSTTLTSATGTSAASTGQPTGGNSTLSLKTRPSGNAEVISPAQPVDNSPPNPPPNPLINSLQIDITIQPSSTSVIYNTFQTDCISVTDSSFEYSSVMAGTVQLSDISMLTSTLQINNNYPLSLCSSIEPSSSLPVSSTAYTNSTQSSTTQPSINSAASSTTQSSTNSAASSTTQSSTNSAASSTTQSGSNSAASNTTQPSSNSAASSTTQPSSNSAASSTTQPSSNSAASSTTQPSSNSAASSTTQSSTNSAASSTTQPSSNSAASSTTQPSSNSAASSTTQPSSNSAASNTTQPSSNSAASSTTQTSSKSAQSSTPQPSSNSAASSTTQTSSKSAQSSTPQPSSNSAASSTTQQSTNSAASSTTQQSTNPAASSTTQPSSNSAASSTTQPSSNSAQSSTPQPSKTTERHHQSSDTRDNSVLIVIIVASVIAAAVLIVSGLCLYYYKFVDHLGKVHDISETGDEDVNDSKDKKHRDENHDDSSNKDDDDDRIPLSTTVIHVNS